MRIQKNKSYSLMSVTISFGGQQLDQGEFTFSTLNGSQLIKLSEENYGTPVDGKMDNRTIVYSLKIKPTMRSETHMYLMDYVIKEVYSDSLNYKRDFYFDDGSVSFATSNAFCVPPDDFEFTGTPSQSEFTIYFWGCEAVPVGQ